MQINLVRNSGKFNFTATNETGFSLEMDASKAIGGEGKGFRPMEMLLAGLGGCSGIDVVNMLNKQKEPLEDIRISIHGLRREDQIPGLFKEINIHFDLYGNIDTHKAERALQLTFEKYCSVAIILGNTAEIKYTFKIFNP